MQWPPLVLDLNPIENLWTIGKMKGGKRYNSKTNLWGAIKTTKSEIVLVV